MRGTRIKHEVEIFATNVTNKTKCMSTNARKCRTMGEVQKSSNSVCVIHRRQNPLESIAL
jgi:hypothetical protein